MNQTTNFEAFLASWREDIIAGQPSTVELGRRFAHKIVTQWLDAPDTGMELVYCDGAGDGGVDLAILDVGPEDENEGEQGHTWYLVQSKHGSAFQGSATLIIEAQKVIDTLDGRRTNLNSLAEGLLERLTIFRSQAGPNDKIVLVFATERPLGEGERKTLDDIRVLGRQHLGGMFDVESVSVETIFMRLGDDVVDPESCFAVTLRSHAVPSGSELLVGSTTLVDLYEFLLGYRDATGDLDQIYEKNVRRFLGGRGKVNKGMQDTLRDAPERFGLYNNGITIVASDWSQEGDAIDLVDPYIVNGCQTSRTIWEVFHRRYSAGGTGVNPEIEEWKARAADGAVVTKIVKVGAAGEQLLQAITRYTNSQNAVREKDFLALSSDFRSWQVGMAESYGIYLEVQRGGWDSQRALQNANPSTHQFQKHVNAADLIKVFGAGWLGEAGTAFGKNPPFLPEGAVFKRIVAASDEGSSPFGIEDLYSAYLLQEAADAYGFGRGGQISRRQSRFLFYMVAVYLLRDVLSKTGMATDNRTTSEAMAKVLTDTSAREALLQEAIEVIDTYFTQGGDQSVFQEPSLVNTFNSDLNSFLKSEKLGKSMDFAPRLFEALALAKMGMGKSFGGQPSARQSINSALANG
ncbi:AIPR family protein [Altererythrobacter sp. TH136]|uniref:AIPR family protein n=1 Tax=Altererythrobacter sp. TH136 TaxID=2067415 RepID=UPI001161D7FB|nr:AIPR family protein [Altererythrobacter sp. TH136]QDM40805.1 AIPR family protein [Altererythrobacter sp. TH136]